MDEDKAQAAEVEVQPQTETEPQEEIQEQPLPIPEMVAKTELDKVLAEKQAVADELERVKKTQSGYDKAYTRVSQAVDSVQQQMQVLNTEAQNQKMILMAKAQQGTLDETHGTLEQQISSIDRDVQSKAAGLQAQRQTENFYTEIRESIFELMSNAGLDPKDLANPQVAEIEAEWRKAVTSGVGLGNVFKKASSIVAQKKGTSETVSQDTIKQQVEQEIHEQVKKSPALRVDTGQPTAAISTSRDIVARYAAGDPNVSSEEYAKAMRKITQQ